MKIIFETPRLFLRQFTLNDADLLLQLNSDPEILKYLHEPLLQDEAHSKEILTKIILPQYEKGLGRWATYTRDNNEFIGWCGLKWLPDRNEIDLGYRFMKKYWGHGFATESAGHCLEYGFNTLELQKIIGRAHIENIASLKVLKKIGMQYLKDEIVDNCPVNTFIAVNPPIC